MLLSDLYFRPIRHGNPRDRAAKFNSAPVRELSALPRGYRIISSWLIV